MSTNFKHILIAILFSFTFISVVFLENAVAASTKFPVLKEQFLNLSETKRKKIQLTLSGLGLYKYSQDGLYTNATEFALTSYNRLYFGKKDLSIASDMKQLLRHLYELSEISKTCATDASICTHAQLCEKATYGEADNKKWYNSSANQYVAQAKKNGLTCHVKAESVNKTKVEKGILFEGKFFCEEISAKAFSVNGEVRNVKMDGEGLEVEIGPKGGKNFLTTKFPSLSFKTKYEGVISLLNNDAKGNQILNAQFVAPEGSTFGTKTVTFIFQQSTGLSFLISTEPFALGTDYPAIRSHFHQCKGIKGD